MTAPLTPQPPLSSADESWLLPHFQAMVQAQPDATAAPTQQALPPPPSLGPQTAWGPSQQRPLPVAPQGLRAAAESLVDPSSPSSRILSRVPYASTAVSALRAGWDAAKYLDGAGYSPASLTKSLAFPAIAALGGADPTGGEGAAESELANQAESKLTNTAGLAAARAAAQYGTPLGIHEAGSDHPTLAPRYEFTNPTTGQPNEMVLAAEDGGRTLRVNNVGPVRTNYGTAPTDKNNVGPQSMLALARYVAQQHPNAAQLIGDRGDGRIAAIDLTKLR